MKRLVPALRFLRAALVFALIGAAALAARSASDDEVNRATPGDDFFAFANRDWLSATRIPDGKARWTARNEIDALTKQQLVRALAGAASQPAGSPGAKVAAFHAARLDSATIEARGISPLRPVLQRIAAVRDKAALVRLIASELRADVDPLNLGVYASPQLFGLAVQRGIHGESRHFAYLLQGGLGLPDRDAYLSDSAAAHATQRAYRRYIAAMLEDAGFAHGAARADAVFMLETAIARSHATQQASGDERNADRLWTMADFAANAPGIDWRAFFEAAGVPTTRGIVAWQPGAAAGEAALIASQPLAVWQDYLRFHAIDRHAEVLPRAFAERASAMRALAAGAPAASREEQALAATNAALPEAVGQMYAEVNFPPSSKARVQAIVADVRAAFQRRVETLTWMTPATRALAVAKLKTLYFGVGYPERWTDHAGLAIDARDAFGNQQRVARWDYQRALARLSQPADPHAWALSPQTVGAVYLTVQNAYNFPSALLQAPKFDATASDASNYGAIGAIVGHEISHFIDTLGADDDASGAMRHWWTDEDAAGFKAACEPLVAQFSGYRPLPDLAVDGRLALSENVADLGGLNAAFDAYRRTVAGKVNDPETLRQFDREFFIGFARSWRSQTSDAALRQQAASDHAPETLRISTVRNIDAWYEAFDVRPGQKLYLEPKARVRIW